MDTIHLSGLEFYGFHGASDEEQKIGHRYSIDASLHVDTLAAGQTDNLALTVNYAEVATCLLEIGTKTQFRLIEALIEVCAKEVFARFPLVQSLELTISKRLPPMPFIVESVGVTIHRERVARDTFSPPLA